MPYFEIIWNDEPGGNVEHIAEHDLEPEDIEEVFFNPMDRNVSRSSGLPIVFGFTPDGRYIMVVYEQIDDVTVYPVTAYDVEE
ncbi:MAG: BrnT family toxin [Pirellulaceae bacterium]|nr:BrnT family toxin [Pirellulaceae bacterium]